MRILRSLKRRGFDVGSAGYFSVLGQNTWFAASRLTDGFESLPGRSNGRVVARSAGLGLSAAGIASGTAIAPPVLGLIPHERRPLRAVCLAGAAMAITLGMLWWMMHP